MFVGSGYYEVDNEIKKLSFVLVSGSESEHGNVSLNNRKIISDSRGSCEYLGAKLACTIKIWIPAYLVIIDLGNHQWRRVGWRCET